MADHTMINRITQIILAGCHLGKTDTPNINVIRLIRYATLG